jgi:hypothetical protein
MIHRHGPLSSSYLHEFSKHICRNEKRARDRLTDLFNEDRTPHGGPYLERPWQQFDTYDARYQELVYHLAPAAERALKEHNLWNDYAQRPTGPWKHRFMVASITSSIELATIVDPDLRYISQEEILTRAEARLRYPVPFKNPRTGKAETRDLIPDALFGLEYQNANQPGYRFFVVEADRGTEPSRSSRFNRKSFERNLLQYRQYVGQGLYKEHLCLKAGMMVLNVMTSATTMQRVLELMEEISPNGNSYMLFQVAEGFGQYLKPSGQLLSLANDGWRRAGLPDFLITSHRS